MSGIPYDIVRRSPGLSRAHAATEKAAVTERRKQGFEIPKISIFTH